MPLTSQQRAALTAKAKEAGVDPDKLIAEAEAMQSGPPAGKSGKPASELTDEPGNLFMYLLPFVTVGEVRRIWLKVPGSLPGADDNTNAAEWAAQFAPGASPAPASE
jgi:hypothetical protein